MTGQPASSPGPGRADAQVICGHKDINTTMGYNAIYPHDTIEAHRAFIARRRALRPAGPHTGRPPPKSRTGPSGTSRSASSPSASADAPSERPASTNTPASAAPCFAPSPPSARVWWKSATTCSPESRRPNARVGWANWTDSKSAWRARRTNLPSSTLNRHAEVRPSTWACRPSRTSPAATAPYPCDPDEMPLGTPGDVSVRVCESECLSSVSGRPKGSDVDLPAHASVGGWSPPSTSATSRPSR